MKLIKNNEHKKSLAKFSYDLAKIVLAITVLTPLTKTDAGIDQIGVVVLVGAIVTIVFFILGYLIEYKEF